MSREQRLGELQVVLTRCCEASLNQGRWHLERCLEAPDVGSVLVRWGAAVARTTPVIQADLLELTAACIRYGLFASHPAAAAVGALAGAVGMGELRAHALCRHLACETLASEDSNGKRSEEARANHHEGRTRTNGARQGRGDGDGT